MSFTSSQTPKMPDAETPTGIVPNMEMTGSELASTEKRSTEKPNTAIPNTAIPNTAIPNTAIPNAELANEKLLYRKTARLVAGFLGAVAAASLVISWIVAGIPGVWAALIGIVLTALFCGSTLWSITHSIGATPMSMAATVMLTWLLKLVVLIVVLFILRGRDFYNPYVLFAVIAVGIIGALVVQALALKSSKLPYVTPQ